jgi:UDP-N-acetylmuramyl pentapeptide synthase
MLELGPGEAAFHEEIGAAASAAGVELLVTVGPLAERIGAAFDGGAHHHAPDARAAAALVPDLLGPGDTVLVKGSRGVGLEVVAQALEG